MSPYDLEDLMDTDIKSTHEEELRAPSTVTRIGDAMPGLGIVAAVLGVVIKVGLIAFAKNCSPKVCVEFARRTVLPSLRQTFKEYEASIVKAVSVMNYFVKNDLFSEDRIHPIGAGLDREHTETSDNGEVQKGRRVQFTFKQFKNS